MLERTERGLYYRNKMRDILVSILVALTTVLTPVVPFVSLVGLFVLLDTFMGVYVTIKVKGFRFFRSNKFFNVIVKGVYYGLGIIMAFLIDTNIFGGSLLGVPLLSIKIVSLLCLYTEIKSIDENQMKLGNDSLWQQLKDMIKKGKEIKKDLGELIDDDKKEE